MNKANVFLLVVVSSLLTYISTATQPAATAGVAQEKWEYGKSGFYYQRSEGKITGTNFSFVSCKKDMVRRAFIVMNLEESSVTYDIFGRRGTQKIESSSDYASLTLELWGEIGNLGWQPYQVDPKYTEPSDKQIEQGFNLQELDTIYWRRRVQ